MMPIGRRADASDLPSLLALFEVSEVSAIAQPRERAESIWQETLARPGVHVFVSDDSDRIAATSMLVIDQTFFAAAAAMGSWRTLSLILSHEAGVMARRWYWLPSNMHGQPTAITC